MTLASDEGVMYLVPVAGPPLEPMRLVPDPAGLTVGRHQQCTMQLPADRVSRQHARFTYSEDGWRVSDLGSRWGTAINGVSVAAGPEVPLREGDLIRIAP